MVNGWSSHKLSDLSSMKSGLGITEASIEKSGNYPCYGGNGLRGFTTKYTHDGQFALIGRQGALCGNVTLVAGRFFASEHAVVVTPKANTDIVFLSYVLTDMRLNQYSESSAQPGLSVNKVLGIECFAPNDKNEQRAIAAALSDVDAYIAVLDKLIAKKRAIKKGAMQELLTGKRRLPGFEGEWDAFELEKVADLYDNLRIPIAESLRERGQIPYYGANGIQDYVKGYTHDGEFVLVAEDGANDLSNYPVRYVKGKIWVNNHAHVLQGKADKADTRFLAYAMAMVDYQAILVGGTRAKLNGSVLKKITISLPDKNEQTAISDVLSDMDSEIDVLTAKLEKARRIKQGMMSELLTGKIRLIEEDTDDGEN
ncbi:restriction endonuclease subunit S [Paenibacillus elgii]